MLNILADLVRLYSLVLFVRIILTWFPTNPFTPLGKTERALGKVTDPVLAPVRRVVPPLRVGGSAIDLSALIVFVALAVIAAIL